MKNYITWKKLTAIVNEAILSPLQHRSSPISSQKQEDTTNKEIYQGITRWFEWNLARRQSIIVIIKNHLSVRARF